ncbi:MAG: uroporphyrinogen decarboxylase family protein [Planctomycetota bacterium]|jgi:uroporphyrinogen decarboxylase
MTSRERVLAAIERKRTDRAPADYGAHKAVTDRLIERLGVADREELLQALGVDMRRVDFGRGQPMTGPDADGYMRDMWGARHPDTKPGALTRPTRPRRGWPDSILPFGEATTVDDVHANSWPDPDGLDYSTVRERCEAHHAEYVSYGGPWNPFFHEAARLTGQENFFVWMATKPEVVGAIIDHVVDYEVEVSRRFLEAAGGRIDITYVGNDFGTQRGLFISPEMWQRFIRRPLKRFFEVARDYGCRTMLHSCGAIRGIIPWLIEDGLDILDPVQVRAADMDLGRLVRDFGRRLTFHGGVDTQRTLPFGTEADVRAEVRSYRELTRERGGYILCGSQSFIEDIPLDNILAMYDENSLG